MVDGRRHSPSTFIIWIIKWIWIIFCNHYKCELYQYVLYFVGQLFIWVREKLVSTSINKIFIVTFRLWMSYFYFNLDDNSLSIYKTIKFRKISKLDNDIIFEYHYCFESCWCYVCSFWWNTKSLNTWSFDTCKLCLMIKTPHSGKIEYIIVS
jgi:hypothetical protein